MCELLSNLTLKFLLTHLSKKEMAGGRLQPASKTRWLCCWIPPGLPQAAGFCLAGFSRDPGEVADKVQLVQSPPPRFGLGFPLGEEPLLVTSPPPPLLLLRSFSLGMESLYYFPS